MQATTQHSCFWRHAALAALLVPLLATGPCLTTAEQSIINGFFDAVTPLLVERVSEELGVTTTADLVPPTGGQIPAGSSGSQTPTGSTGVSGGAT